LVRRRTNEPLIADHRNFYKAEKWTRDGMKVESMLYAGSNLDIHRSHQAPATYPPDNQAADWSVAAVAAAMKSPGPGAIGRGFCSTLLRPLRTVDVQTASTATVKLTPGNDGPARRAGLSQKNNAWTLTVDRYQSLAEIMALQYVHPIIGAMHIL
jgi:hypothetical protein